MKKAANPGLRRRVIGVVLAGLLLFGIWYHIPLHRVLEVTVYDSTGTSAILQMDITLHRSFFRETVVRGAMELDGVSYVSAPRMEPKPNSFLDGLRYKWIGYISSGHFVEAERLAGRGDYIYMMEDSLQIFSISFRGFYDSIEGLFLIRHSPDAPNVVYTADPLTY